MSVVFCPGSLWYQGWTAPQPGLNPTVFRIKRPFGLAFGSPPCFPVVILSRGVVLMHWPFARKQLGDRDNAHDTRVFRVSVPAPCTRAVAFPATSCRSLDPPCMQTRLDQATIILQLSCSRRCRSMAWFLQQQVAHSSSWKPQPFVCRCSWFSNVTSSRLKSEAGAVQRGIWDAALFLFPRLVRKSEELTFL